MTAKGTARTEPTRLEEHRRSFKEMKGAGPLLPLDELGADEVALVNQTFLELCRRDRVDGIDQIYRAYVEALHEWGVMCPHPQHQRRYGGWQKSDVPLSFDDGRWYDCGMCGASVINR